MLVLMNRSTKKIAIIGILLAVIVILFAVRPFADKEPKIDTGDNKTKQTNTKQTPSETNKPSTVRFVAMGDMLPHDSVVANAKSGNGYDFAKYFSRIQPSYKDADVVFCNPEAIAAGEDLGISGYPAFNAPTEFARDLVKGAGCNLIALANNHINDKGQSGIDANLEVWDKLDVIAKNGSNRSSEEQGKVAYFTKNDIKFAFLAFADYSNNTNLTDYGLNNYHNRDLVNKLMNEARANADAVIVSAHWGRENTDRLTSDQQTSAQMFADLGADVVIGSGPHVLQRVSTLSGKDNRKTLVWYSIGNMLSSQITIDQLTGAIAGFTIKKEASGVKVSDPSIISTFMSYDWPAADRAIEKLDTRTNLQLLPLADSGDAVSKMFGSSYSANERINYVKKVTANDSVLVR